MKTFTLCIAALLATLVGVSNSNAQELIYDLTATDTVVGGTVNWELSVTSIDTPFGIDAATVNITDSAGSTMLPGTLDMAWDGYVNKFTGFPSGSSLLGVGVSSANIGGVQGATTQGTTGTQLVLATGSFTTAVAAGMSYSLDLNASALGLQNLYFTSAGQTGGLGTAYGTILVNHGSYNVSAVPEPGSFAMFGLALLGFARRRRG